MINRDYQKELLTSAIDARIKAVTEYQVNIDNFRLAIAEIEEHYSGNSDMVDFADQLRGLLSDSIREQTKERILLKVIEKQLEAENVG